MSLMERLAHWLGVIPIQQPDDLYREAEAKESSNQQEIHKVRLEYLAELRAMLEREDNR